jgi:hypothetical protein
MCSDTDYIHQQNRHPIKCLRKMKTSRTADAGRRGIDLDDNSSLDEPSAMMFWLAFLVVEQGMDLGFVKHSTGLVQHPHRDSLNQSSSMRFLLVVDLTECRMNFCCLECLFVVLRHAEILPLSKIRCGASP